MTDVWVCSSCKSINRERDPLCYSCGERNERVELPGVVVLEADGSVSRHRPRAMPSSSTIGIIAGVLISLAGAIGIFMAVDAIVSFDAHREAFLAAMAADDSESMNRIVGDLDVGTPIGVIHRPIAIVAMLLFAVWLSRDGRSPMPAGFEDSASVMWRARDRLDGNIGGFLLALLAFAALVGGWMADTYGSQVIRAAIASGVVADPTRDELVPGYGAALDQLLMLKVGTELLTAIGAILLVVIIARAEIRAAAHNRAIGHAEVPTWVDARPGAPMAAPPDDAGRPLPPPPPIPPA